MLRTGEVSFCAVMRRDGECRDVEVVVCPNDEAVLAAFDQLVLLSVGHIEEAL